MASILVDATAQRLMLYGRFYTVTDACEVPSVDFPRHAAKYTVVDPFTASGGSRNRQTRQFPTEL